MIDWLLPRLREMMLPLLIGRLARMVDMMYSLPKIALPKADSLSTLLFCLIIYIVGTLLGFKLGVDLYCFDIFLVMFGIFMTFLMVLILDDILDVFSFVFGMLHIGTLMVHIYHELVILF